MAFQTARPFTGCKTAPRVCIQRAYAPALAAPMRPLLSQRGALQVVKAEDGEAAPKEKKEPKKLPPRMDSAVKRAKIAEDRRMTNKAFKSAVATRVKKVLKMVESMMANPPKTEDEMKPLQELVNEAYKTIDKAVTKGVIHANTGGRRKARVAKHKRELLIAAGLYKPAVGQPGYHKYQQMQAKSS